MDTQTFVQLVIALTAGAIPFGWIIAKLWGVNDLRTVGSTNVGATNVVRTAGWIPGALTFLFDFAKGSGPMLYFASNSEIPVIWLGAAAVIGHCFSPFLSFRGGKGVSTTLGAMIALNPWIGGASILVYLLVLLMTRTSAIGSLFAMLTALTGTLIFVPSPTEKIITTMIVAIVLGRHHENWNKLLKDTAALFVIAFLGTCSLPKAFALNQTAHPKRIAALIPSLAETVVELGAGAKLVAAPDYSRLPKSISAAITWLGPYNRISAEAVYASHPDLVLASMDGNSEKLVTTLEKMGLRIITVNSRSLEEIVKSIQLLAVAIGDSKNQAIEKAQKILQTHAASSGQPKRVFIQVGWDPLVTVSKRTFISELIRRAGGLPLFEDAPMAYPRPNAEEVIAKDPEVLIICRLSDSSDEAERAIKFWSRFKNLAAVKTKNIHVIPGDWLAKPGLSLIRGIEELHKIL